MKTIVTHENFDRAISLVESGKAKMLIPTYSRTTLIDAKTVAKFSIIGIPVIQKSLDGKGFRLASGDRSLYILPGQLLLVNSGET